MRDVFRIYTWHLTQMVMNDKGETVHLSTEKVLSSHLPIYAQPFEDGIAFFIIKNNKIVYLASPLGARPESDSPIKIPIENNADGSISLILGDQFLSARHNGTFDLVKKNSDWEHITLDKAEFELSAEYVPSFVKEFEPTVETESSLRTTPAISVVIPMFNAEGFIEEALESVLNQTFDDYEVIVVDDCSTDRSIEIVEGMIDRFNGKLKLIRLPKNNGEAGSPRNIGMNYAIGKYIFFLDSDDKLLEKAFELLYDTAEQTHADLIDNGKYYFFWRNNSEREPKLNVNKNIRQLTFNQADVDKRIRDFCHNRFWITPWCKFLRREFLIENRIIFPPTCAIEDATFTFQCIVCAKIFVRVPYAFYMYNIRSGSITKARRPLFEHLDRYVKTVTAVYEVLENFMDRVEFFVRHPTARYMVIKRFFDYHLNGGVAQLRAQYDKNCGSVIHSIIEQIISEGGIGFSDELMAIFLASTNSRTEQLNDSAHQIEELERELKQLKTTKNPAV